jgi:large subunit ribosomal protein L9
MKVILQRDVARLGKRNSIVTVPDGYALNKLVPQGLALPATPEAIKRLETVKKEVSAHTASTNEAILASLEAIKQAGGVQIAVTSNAQGHLFKAVHEAEIATAMAALGHVVDGACINIPVPIKSLGIHAVEVLVDGRPRPLTVEIISA